MPPRPFFAALAAFLTFSLVLLLFHRQSSVQSFSYPGSFASGRSLSAWVLDEDARYSVVLQDRQELIRKWATTFGSCVLPMLYVPFPIIDPCAHMYSTVFL
jgi:hypothetical protein